MGLPHMLDIFHRSHQAGTASEPVQRPQRSFHPAGAKSSETRSACFQLCTWGGIHVQPVRCLLGVGESP
eukprot:6450155-Pyramimonas_sp.AAC.1